MINQCKISFWQLPLLLRFCFFTVKQRAPVFFTKDSINTLTTYDEYSRTNRENLPLPIQIQLSEKLKTFSEIFIAFLECTLNLEHFEKKMSLIAQVFLKLLTLKDLLT